MQTQADLLRREVQVADLAEASALGAARMGWSALKSTSAWSSDLDGATRYAPRHDDPAMARRRRQWQQAVRRSRLGQGAG
jgi:glycerol kinase